MWSPLHPNRARSIQGSSATPPEPPRLCHTWSRGRHRYPVLRHRHLITLRAMSPHNLYNPQMITQSYGIGTELAHVRYASSTLEQNSSSPKEGSIVPQHHSTHILAITLFSTSLILSSCLAPENTPRSTIPPLKTATATHTPTSPSEKNTSAEKNEINTNSLSDASVNYTVTSIPDNLDETKLRIVEAFIKYDKAAWVAFTKMDGIGDVKDTAIDKELDKFKHTYDHRDSSGSHLSGSVSISIKAVEFSSDDIVATLFTCTDQTQVHLVNRQGNEEFTEDLRHTFSMTYSLNRTKNSWVVSNSSQTGFDQC